MSVRVDSHCHVSDIWYEPAETLLFQMDRCGVDRAVLVQLLGQADNDYQQACVKAWPDRFVSVVAVDPNASNAIGLLKAFAEAGAVGVRLRPQARSPGDDPFAIWRCALQLGLAVSCVGPASAFRAPNFADLLSELPDLRIVIEHLGGIGRPDADEDAEEVFALAAYPNVFLKVPGLGQLGPRTAGLSKERPLSSAAAAPLMKALNTFGANRLMWGSDFPPVAAREGYANALVWVEDALKNLPLGDRSAVLGEVANSVFGRRG